VVSTALEGRLDWVHFRDLAEGSNLRCLDCRVAGVGDAKATAVRFNAMINARDVDGLASLMTDGHSFIDTGGHTVSGKQACREVWSGFFATFPTYRNVFEFMHEREGVVIVVGRSVCSDDSDLEGPALWTARVDGNLVAEWRVHDDTPEGRRRLGIAE